MKNHARRALVIAALALASPPLATARLKAEGPQAASPTSAPMPHDGSMRHSAPGDPTPYAGLAGREIKALSAEQVDQLLGGQGMGFALAAELNHYPGPRHALELATPLGLSAEQRAQILAIQAAMSAEAVRLGKQVVEQERELDRRFASGRIDLTELRALTGAIARRQGELRAAHLGAHLAVRALLSEGQILHYDELRGYAARPGSRAPVPPTTVR